MKKSAIVCVISVILSLFLGSCKPNPHNEELLTTLNKNLNVSSEMVELSANEKLLKIDCIKPELDTYSLRVILYSLKKNKKLCEVDLGEDAWNTGLTKNGFYAISLRKQEIVVYGTNGSEKFRRKITDAGDLWGFAMLSDTADQLLVGHSKNAEIIQYSLDDRKQTVVGNIRGYIKELGFYDNYFYLHKGAGELLRIGLKDEIMESVYYSPEISFYSKEYGVGTDDMDFIAVSAKNRYTTNRVAMTSVDEIPIAAYENGFATLVSMQDGDLLRIYDVAHKKIQAVPMKDSVQRVVFLNENKLVISAKDKAQNNTIYLCNLSKAESKPMEFHEKGSQNPTPSDTTTSSTDTTTNGTEPLPSSTPAQNRTLIAGVPLLAQMPNFPTGCEAVSAVMALRFAGESVSVDEFVDQYLDKNSDFYYAGDTKYGPSPWEYFIGHPRSKASYGCMAPVIEKALNKYFGNEDRVANTTGFTLDELCQEYIDNNIPVLVWTSIKMIDTYPTNTWTLSDGTTYTWIANEHCMVLVGYDQEYYYFNDPYTGKQLKYDKALSQKRCDTFDKQSLVIL